MMVAEILLLGMDPFVNGVCCVNLNVSVQIIFLMALDRRRDTFTGNESIC